MAVVEYYFWKSYYPGATLEDSGKNWSDSRNYIDRNITMNRYHFAMTYFNMSDIDVENPENSDIDSPRISVKNEHDVGGPLNEGDDINDYPQYLPPVGSFFRPSNAGGTDFDFGQYVRITSSTTFRVGYQFQEGDGIHTFDSYRVNIYCTNLDIYSSVLTKGRSRYSHNSLDSNEYPKNEFRDEYQGVFYYEYLGSGNFGIDSITYSSNNLVENSYINVILHRSRPYDSVSGCYVYADIEVSYDGRTWTRVSGREQIRNSSITFRNVHIPEGATSFQARYKHPDPYGYVYGPLLTVQKASTIFAGINGAVRGVIPYPCVANTIRSNIVTKYAVNGVIR